MGPAEQAPASEVAATYQVLLQAVRDAQAADVLSSSVAPVDFAGRLWSAVHGLVDLALGAPAIAERGPGGPRLLMRLLVEQVNSQGSTAPVAAQGTDAAGSESS